MAQWFPHLPLDERCIVPLHDSITIYSTTYPRCEWVVIEDIDSCGCDHLPVVA